MGTGQVGKEGRKSRLVVAALVEKQIDKLFSFIMPRERVRTAACVPFLLVVMHTVKGSVTRF